MNLQSLAPMDVASRLSRLHSALEQESESFDALVVTNLTNIKWLTGFSGSAGLLVIKDADSPAVLLTDGRYAFQAPSETAEQDVDVRISKSVAEQQEMLKDAAGAYSKVALEAEHVSWARQQAFEEQFSELVPLKGVVEGLRRTKDVGEVARIEAAAEIADASLGELLDELASSVRGGKAITEQDFAARHDHRMRKLGASEAAFETIVAAGSNGARPHARPGPRAIQQGELVVIDSGAVVDGYRSDMTRTVSVGEPSETAMKMWEVVRTSQQAGVEAVSAGKVTGEIDKVCREIIKDAGWGEAFMHSTGHGVGLDIHEIPGVSAKGEDTLLAGEVITVEPGIYIAEQGGVRIEDTVLVEDGGCRPLTKTPKVLVI